MTSPDLPSRQAVLPPIDDPSVHVQIDKLARRYVDAGGMGMDILARIGGSAQGLIERLPGFVRGRLDDIALGALNGAFGAASRSRNYVRYRGDWFNRLASTVSGSLSSASSLITNLGTWLSIIVLAVAVALAGTRTPMGLLPRGTGNLLARNLDIPVAGDLTEALRVACSGRNKAIDVAWLELDPAEEAATDDSGQAEEPVEGPPVDRHPFLVMAGMGFDAAIMGNTSEQLKARVGWSAYFVTGIKSIFIQRFRVRWSIDGREQRPVLARTILFGNCGTLTGGIQLIPSARLDDGLVDGIVVAPKTLVGWGSIAVRVLGRSDKAGQELIRTSGAEYTAVVDEPHPVQVDGDVIGEASRLRVTVDRQALVVRVSGV